MTEEEHFRKYYPDFCYGDKPLSPYWDLFQDGVEFGERQSEKKIEELKSELTKKADTNHSLVEQMADLESKNAELKEQIEKQVMIKIDNTPNLYTKQLEEKLCDSQNTTQFWRELAEQRSRANTSIAEEYNVCIGGLQDQLTKAKELIENIIRVTWGEGWNYSLDWKVRAEQFISEI